MKQKLFAVLLLVALMAFMLSACGATETPVPQEPAVTEAPAAEATEAPVATEAPAPEFVTVTDMMGRQVEVPAEVTRVVAIGPGALRLYVYAGNLEYVVGVEEVETGDVSAKPYMLANPDLAKLPVIGQGGPNNAPDPEKLLSVTPDVIFSTYATDAAAADELQAQTGIPVVVINYGAFFGVTSIFDKKVQDTLLLIGQVTGDTSKAEQANAFLQQVREDLDKRTKDIPDDEKPSVYVGALGAKGTHGIESTQGHYSLLEVIHAKNVVDETGEAAPS